MILLGVVAAAYQREVPVLKANSANHAYVNDLLNIGIVYKARTIDETADVLLSKFGLQRSSSQPDEQLGAPGVD
jgi:hypothetical protein